MVRLLPENSSHNWGSTPLAVGLFVSVSALVALCAKHARRSLHKYNNKAITDVKQAPRPKSPLASPRHLLATISNKAMSFKKKESGGYNKEEAVEVEAKEMRFGEDGLWKKAILMGEKCKPPEFAGVIYYDSYGNQLHELPPRSPRASPLSNFVLPVTGNEK
ncbi:putative Transmembrane protein [Melia azedarach]|uniref:Transmembrane protein n=1 Tax=Melia azedarach TaxID=155640 RepID=A0ACC1XGL0_MELAZ|nr:putative Transmembrane protein [Melia azedarach]